MLPDLTAVRGPAEEVIRVGGILLAVLTLALFGIGHLAVVWVLAFIDRRHRGSGRLRQ